MDAPLSLPTQYLTPPQIARRLGVKASKVLAWIDRGELVAANLADRRGGRPRWRIAPEALASFLAARSSRPATQATNRHRLRKREAVIQFF
jgi:excisionase family DNA binding protein